MQLITSLWYGGQENENTGQVQQRSEIDKEKNTESQEVQGTFPLNTQQCLTIAANSFKSDSNSGIPSQLGKMSKKEVKTLPNHAQQDLETSKTESSPSSNIPPPKLKRKEQTSKQKSFYIETFKEKLSLGADKAYDYHQNTKKESFSATYLRQALPDMWEINKNKAIQMALNDIESFDDLLKKKEIVRNAISGILSRFDVDGVTEFVRELLKNLPNTHRSLVSDRQQYFGEKLVWNQEDTLLVAVSVLKGKETDEMDIKKKNVRKVIKFAKDIKPNFDVFPEEFIGQVKSLLENRGLDKDVEGFMSWANPQQKTESH